MSDDSMHWKKGRPIVPTDRHRLAAKLLSEGKSIYDALLEAGYSPKVARQGHAGIAKGIQQALLDMGKGKMLAMQGKALREHPERLHNAIVGSLYDAMVNPRSKGVNAAKALGNHRSVNAFVQDQTQNVLVIQAPADWKPGQFKPSTPEERVKPALPPAESDMPDYEG